MTRSPDRRGRLLAFELLCAMLALGAATAARAHTRSISYSSWELDAAGATVRTRISRLDVTRLGLDPVASMDDAALLARYLAARLELRAGSEVCLPQRPPIPLRAPTGWLLHSWRVQCPEARIAAPGIEPDPVPRSIQSRILLDVAPSHLHFVRLERADGSVLDRVLSAGDPQFRIPQPEGSRAERTDAEQSSAPTSLVHYLGLGTRHILSGWDHLAFVIALLLLARTLAQVASLVTAFTVAHSVTLGLATLDIVRPDAAAVEALIGYSIALVAAENAWLLEGRRLAIPSAALAGLLGMGVAGGGALARMALLGLALFSACHFGLLRRSARPERGRAAVAFAFGLIHGFGFAGVLSELALPTGRLLPALLGFNLGVELGQLAMVAVAWPALRALSRPRDGRPAQFVAEAGSAAICGLGLFWFVTRHFG